MHFTPSLLRRFGEGLEEILPVKVMEKDLLPAVAPARDVMEGPRGSALGPCATRRKAFLSLRAVVKLVHEPVARSFGPTCTAGCPTCCVAGCLIRVVCKCERRADWAVGDTAGKAACGTPCFAGLPGRRGSKRLEALWL
jgi:hypothetical protein